MEHPVLGKRLYEICEVLYSLPGTSAEDIFGKTDAMKLRSCVTLFGLADHSDENVFIRLTDKYFNNYLDQVTISLLGNEPPNPEELLYHL